MINLLPESIKEDMYYGRKNRQIRSWILTSLFGMIILLLVAGFGRLTIQTARNQALAQKQSMEEQLKLADYDQTNTVYGDYVDGLSSTKKLYSQQILYTRLIRKLGALLPPGARLTNISLSDKDQAVGLNFDNDTDGLGPVVQLNLTDQSKQIIAKSNTVFNQGLAVPIASEFITNTNEQSLVFYVSAPNDSAKETLEKSIKSGGDLAFYVIRSQLANYTLEYDSIEASKQSNSDSKLTASRLANISTSQPQIRSYKVDTNKKSVDFTVRASSASEAKELAEVILDTPGSLFIETYTFVDTSYTAKEKCIDQYTDEKTCDTNAQSCIALLENGCQYTVRAYYDELYTTVELKEVSEADKKPCSLSLGCTHQITAKYTQLFSKVDLNRVSACTVDPTTNNSNCPVEMRAEFSPEAKFYLISANGAAK